MTWDVPDRPDPVPLEEERRISACEGKRTLTRWSDAIRVAKRMSQREHTRGTGYRFEPYRCKHCGGIHVGSRDTVTNHNPRTRSGRGKGRNRNDE